MKTLAKTLETKEVEIELVQQEIQQFERVVEEGSDDEVD